MNHKESLLQYVWTLVKVVVGLTLFFLWWAVIIGVPLAWVTRKISGKNVQWHDQNVLLQSFSIFTLGLGISVAVLSEDHQAPLTALMIVMVGFFLLMKGLTPTKPREVEDQSKPGIDLW